MKSLSYLSPAQLLATTLVAAAVCLCFGGGGCTSNVALPVAPGPQTYDVNGSNVNHTGTATVTNLSGLFKLPGNQQLDPPAPLGADGNVVLDPTFDYWLKSDDQVLVSWNDFSLDLPCSGSSNFQYNLCADQTLLQQGASHPSQCPRDILAWQRSLYVGHRRSSAYWTLTHRLQCTSSIVPGSQAVSIAREVRDSPTVQAWEG